MSLARGYSRGEGGHRERGVNRDERTSALETKLDIVCRRHYTTPILPFALLDDRPVDGSNMLGAWSKEAVQTEKSPEADDFSVMRAADIHKGYVQASECDKRRRRGSGRK